MKTIIAVARALALAACGGNAEEAETTEEAAATAEAAPAAASATAGTYTELDTVATPPVVDINADGTYSMTSSEGEQAGSWVENDQGVCMTGSEEGAAESCYTISDADAEGVRTITGADGNGVRYSFAAE